MQHSGTHVQELRRQLHKDNNGEKKSVYEKKIVPLQFEIIVLSPSAMRKEGMSVSC